MFAFEVFISHLVNVYKEFFYYVLIRLKFLDLRIHCMERTIYWALVIELFFLFVGVLDIFMMYGAYSTTRRLAVSRIFIKFLWFSGASVVICFLYVYATSDLSSMVLVYCLTLSFLCAYSGS